MKKRALIIFVKNPELGKCKTRLAASIGDIKALEVYKKLLAHTQNVSLQSNCARLLFYDQKIEDHDDWSSNNFIKKVQDTGDLGAKINHAFNFVLNEYEKAIIIGSDCPQINPSIIAEAFEKLNHNDFVIGPTLDGGYYLLGMKSKNPFLFSNMTWSVDSVYQTTINRILEHKKTYVALEKLSDLDNIEDLKKFPEFDIFDN